MTSAINHSRPHRARGFTILEVVMASVLGLLVASGCFAIFTALNKTDHTLDRRYHETVELERLHSVMQRSFMSLVVSGEPKPQPIRKPGTDGSTDNPAAPTSKFDKPANDATADANNHSTGARLGDDRMPIPGSRQSKLRDGPSTPANTDANGPNGKPTDKPDGKSPALKLPPPPRMLLRPDPSVADIPMNHRLAHMQTAAPTQRFELVLSSFPVAATSTLRTTSLDSSDDAQRKAAPDLGDLGRAVRGQFFLRPTDELVPGISANRPPNQPRSWTLYWQPLRAPDGIANPDPRVVDYVPAGQSVPIATNLAYCRWQVFDDRVRKVDFDATWYEDIPAYIEMEVETVGGLWASWMFEVDWSKGQESAPADDSDPADPTKPGSSSKGTPAGGASSKSASPKATSATSASRPTSLGN